MNITKVLKVVIGLSAAAGAILLTSEVLYPIVEKQTGIKKVVCYIGASAIASVVGAVALGAICDSIDGYATLGKALSEIKL